MPLMPDNVRQEIIKIVPAPVVNDISSFTFFDSHPRDPNKIDITVCTKAGEVKEFYQREVVLSLHLNIPKPSEITIIRNDNLELFYLVFGGDELVILSRREDLQILKSFKNVNKYELQDSLCSGRARVKIFVKDDAVPLVLDDSFEVEEFCTDDRFDESMPILNELMRKLIQAKFNVQYNEMMYEYMVKLRQIALFSKYQNININTDEAVYKSSMKEITSALKIETLTPWVKICNNKVVVVFDIVNQDEHPLQDVHILLHGTSQSSIAYTTRLFEKINDPPFWREKTTHHLKRNKKTALAVVINFKEFKGKVVFDAVIMFNKLKKEFLLPLERVALLTLDTMKEDFDVLNNSQIDDPNTILAIIATSERTDLNIRQLGDGEPMPLQDIFCTHMKMEQILNTSNIVVHKKSPYHALHGVMILFHDENSSSDVTVSVFSRLPSQVIALTHYIQDAVPAKILITTPNYKITAKTDEFICYNEDINNTDSDVNYTEYAASILKRTTMLLEYLDGSMVKMNENKAVQSKIGKEIHLFANGVARYVEFRNKMLEMADEGVKSCIKSDTNSEDSEPLFIE